MVNQYKMQRIIGLGVAAAVPTLVTIFIMVLTKDIVIATFMGMATIPLMVFAGGTFITSPFCRMLEGDGVLVLDTTSGGIIKPYIASVNMPYIDLTIGKNGFRNIYNRTIGMYLKTPQRAKMDDTGENVKFELPKDDYSKTYFMLGDKPILFWNSKLNTFFTKEDLAEKENSLMIENTALQILDQTRGMRGDLHELTRTVVDQFKPSGIGELLRNPWFVMIVAVATIFLLFMFVAPQLPKFFGYLDAGAKAVAPSIPVSPVAMVKGFF